MPKALFCDPNSATKPAQPNDDPTELSIMICCGRDVLTNDAPNVSFPTMQAGPGDGGVRVTDTTHTDHHIFVDVEITYGATDGGHYVRIEQGQTIEVSDNPLFTVRMMGPNRGKRQGNIADGQ